MNVHVHPARVHVEKQRKERERLVRQQLVVGFPDGVAEVPVLYIPAVHEQELVGLSALATGPGVDDEATHREFVKPVLDGDEHTVLIDLKQIGNSLEQRLEGVSERGRMLGEMWGRGVRRFALCGGQVVQHPVLMLHLERDAGMGEGQRPKDVREMLELRGRRLQEVSARGHVVKQVSNRDRSAPRECTRANVHEVSPVDPYLRTDVVFDALGLQFNPGDGRDRRQRLSPEPERTDPIEVVNLPDLAGRVTLEAAAGVRAAHAASVVDHLNERAASIFDHELNRRCSSVDRVFDQFFRDRRRTLDDLPRRDLVGERVRHLPDDAVPLCARGRIVVDRWPCWRRGVTHRRMQK